MNKYGWLVVLLVFLVLLGAALVGVMGTGGLDAAAAPPKPSEASTVTTFYVIYVRGCDFLGQEPVMDKTVYSTDVPLVSFPQLGAVDVRIPPHWVEKRDASGEVFFEGQPAYQIRATGIPCVVNWVNEKRELPVRK